MALLLHAILDAETPDGGGRPELTRVATDRLAAWAEPYAGRVVGRADMLAHHEVVAALHEHSPACLPARFPTLIDDADALRKLLMKRQSQLCAALERVRGCSELAVTALWTSLPEATPVPASTPGRRYLLARQQALHSAEAQRALATALADEVQRMLGDDVVAAERKVCPTPETALSLALLVPRARAISLAAHITSTYAGDGVRILVNGPWPPYTFAAVAMKEE